MNETMILAWSGFKDKSCYKQKMSLFFLENLSVKLNSLKNTFLGSQVSEDRECTKPSCGSYLRFSILQRHPLLSEMKCSLSALGAPSSGSLLAGGGKPGFVSEPRPHSWSGKETSQTRTDVRRGERDLTVLGRAKPSSVEVSGIRKWVSKGNQHV